MQQPHSPLQSLAVAVEVATAELALPLWLPLRLCTKRALLLPLPLLAAALWFVSTRTLGPLVVALT